MLEHRMDGDVNDMGVYIELPKEWTKWSFDVRDTHDNILKAKRRLEENV